MLFLGFTWSPYFAQSLGDELTASEAADERPKESPTARYVHADNLGVQQRWVEAFESHEPHLHKSAVFSTRCDSLTVNLDLQGRWEQACWLVVGGFDLSLHTRGVVATWESQCFPLLLPVSVSQLFAGGADLQRS